LISRLFIEKTLTEILVNEEIAETLVENGQILTDEMFTNLNEVIYNI
jgi:hypothetical protein